jgi:transcription initiation factor TFIIIB Brf1 subunit/transcription initiation factor TFIIB
MELESLLEQLHKSKSDKKILTELLASEKNLCPACNSTDIIESEGYAVCRSCGIRDKCVLDQGQEWRYYGGDDNTKSKDPARCGMPTNELLPNTGMGIILSHKGKETHEMKKVRNLQYWSHLSYKESSLIKVFNNITILSQNGGISSCITEEAKIMYMKVSALKTSRRIKKDCMKAASVSLACKFLNVPRSCDEICVMFNITNKKLFRKALKLFEEIWFSIEARDKNEHLEKIKAYLAENPVSEISITDWKDIRSQMDKCEDSEAESAIVDDVSADDTSSVVEEAEYSPDISIVPPLIAVEPVSTEGSPAKLDDSQHAKSYNSNSYLHRLCCKLGIDDKIYDICQETCDEVDRRKILDKHNPLSRTTTIIYYIITKFNIPLSKQQISVACGVSEVTINKCYAKMMHYYDQEKNLTLLKQEIASPVPIDPT